MTIILTRCFNEVTTTSITLAAMEIFWKWIVLVSTLMSFSILTTSSDKISCEYETMTEFLYEVTTKYPHLTQLHSIGKTVEDREIWVVIVSDSPYNRPLLRPQVKLVGNVNGMSGTACYVLLRLIKHLVEQYQHEASLERKLLESVEIHVIANLNPDGYSRAIPGSCYSKDGRENANGIDLNGDFPELFNDSQPKAPKQNEVKAMMDWIMYNRFILSVSLIGGAKVVVYPFDSYVDEYDASNGKGHATPDDDIFNHLAKSYVRASTLDTWRCPRLAHFPEGIVNGAAWHSKRGTMMDYNYDQGVFEIMVGVSCCRNSNDTDILQEAWEEHKKSLLVTIGQARLGIRGEVVDMYTNKPITNAGLLKREADYEIGDTESYFSVPFYTSLEGEFWRLWRPGNYKLVVFATGYKTANVPIVIRSDQPTYIKVLLEPEHKPTHTPSTMTTMNIIPSTEGPKSLERKTAASIDVETPIEKEVVIEPVVRESTGNKFSSLTQFDNSFISVLQKVFNYNSQCKLSGNYHVIFVMITMVILR